MLVLRKIEQRTQENGNERKVFHARPWTVAATVDVPKDLTLQKRLIIPINELAKATNNFEKARELGGGAYATFTKEYYRNFIATKK